MGLECVYIMNDRRREEDRVRDGEDLGPVLQESEDHPDHWEGPYEDHGYEKRIGQGVPKDPERFRYPFVLHCSRLPSKTRMNAFHDGTEWLGSLPMKALSSFSFFRNGVKRNPRFSRSWQESLR